MAQPFRRVACKKAQESGVQVRDGVAFLSCTKKDMQGGENYTESAAYVLDCEGVAGSLKRKITGKVPEYIITFQTFHEDSIELDPHYFYAYLQPELSEYDVWFNVKDDLLVLGVSVKDTGKIRHY